MSSWTPVTCRCCDSATVQPLVVIELAENVQPATKQWIISKIESHAKDGGAQLLAHPGEDDDGDMILVSAPRCTLLQAAEYLGLAKRYNDGSMMIFSYKDRANFMSADDVEEFLTLAEKQYIVKYELNSVKAPQADSIPGVPVKKGTLRPRQTIFQKLEKIGVIKQMYPLHEKQKLDALAKAWYSNSRYWGQPLDSIQSYFGGPVAFYFSFLDFYILCLLPPAVIGLVLFLLPWESMNGYILLAVFNMLWSTVVMEYWKRRGSGLAHRWGTLYLTTHFSEPRPSYWGTLGHNPVTGRLEPYYPSWRRKLRIWLGSVPVVCSFLLLVVAGMVGFYKFEALVSDFHRKHGSVLTSPLLYLPSITHIFYVNVLGMIYRTVALMLTEWENHRVESSFQNHHTVKVLVFSFFNCFAVLFHIAFFRQDLQLLRKRLASLLIVSQILNQCTEVLVPYITDKLFAGQGKKLSEDDPLVDRLRAQGSLPAFPGLFGEYIELFVQFGYLSLFSCVYPLTAILLLLNNITEIRTDALKICRLFRKPFAEPVTSIGVWQGAFEVLGFVSVISNCCLILLSTPVQGYCQESGISMGKALLVTIFLEHCLIALKMIIAFVIPDEPSWVRTEKAKMEYNSLQALTHQTL
ncbi:anoctamin-10 [Lepisosteus oculatus]|uniref:anoctamin-10 n=1 Tax=Lepisosteus oculatus TaxID=7918 RepID=UPI0035F50E0A